MNPLNPLSRGNRPTADRITVSCPHCQGEQQEPAEAISTVCRHCKRYFSLEAKGASAGRRLRKQKPSRLIRCPQCETEQKVYEDALSAVCASCGCHLNIGSYTLEGFVRQRVHTSGDVVFESNVRYSGPEIRGRNVTVSGEIKSARIRAAEAIFLNKKGSVRGALMAPLIRVLRGAETAVDRVRTNLLEADGRINARQIYAREKIHVLSEGNVEAPVLLTHEIIVEPGGSLSGHIDTDTLPPSDGDEETA